MNVHPNTLAAALSYFRAGLCVLPARLADKRPALTSWKEFQKCRPNEAQVQEWFKAAEALCILCGVVSGNAELIDFDNKGELFNAWCNIVRAAAPALLDRLVIETTQNIGKHVAYRCSEPVCGNIRLAERSVIVPDGAETIINGKKYKPRKTANGWEVVLTLIETRGQGGLFLCAPTPGYSLEQGSFDQLPVLTPEERDILLSAAYALNERLPQPEPITSTGEPSEGRPGDDYNQRGDIRALLQKHGWTLFRAGENEHWCRPGKERSTSATLKDGVLYVFSSNAAPFEQNKAYSPFGALAALEHGGDYRKAAASLHSEGFGKKDEPSGVNLSGILNSFRAQDDQIAASNVLKPQDLFNFDPSQDPNILLGTRWLCRGGACLVVGQTGIGKSSFSMQAMISWALGESLFGITPVRPLRSLVVQAENDVGDLSEMFCGVLKGTAWTSRLSELQPMLTFVTETTRSATAFHPWVLGLINEHKPDLVWIDPLFSFFGGNASDQESVSKFLRNGLGGIAQQTGVTWMIVHHTNKPPKEDKRAAPLSGDFAYMGSGSAELANWARAVLSVRQIAPDQYELRASKRGKRAGLVDIDGKQTTEVFLKHGEQGICWERATAPEDERKNHEEDLANDIIAAMKPGQLYTRTELRKLGEATLDWTKPMFTTRTKAGYRVIQMVYERTRNPQQPTLHSVPLNASQDENDDI